jgi:hypothetical protein
VSPKIDLGAPSVNSTVSLEVPNRWLLFTFGPRVGPAVLFWSLLLVLLVVALALGQNHWTPLRTWHWALLFVGLSQVDVVAGAFFVGWLLMLGYRGREKPSSAPSSQWFNLRQVVIVLWTVVALVILVVSLHQGLLGTPEMQVMGNGSNSGLLHWFTDRAGPELPGVRIISVPMLVYRGAMLAWALWIVLSLLSWLKWGWGSFTSGGGWKSSPRPRRPAPVPAVEPPRGPPSPGPLVGTAPEPWQRVAAPAPPPSPAQPVEEGAEQEDETDGGEEPGV